VVILDSIPTVASSDSSSEMEGGTYANRVAKALAQFYKRLTPVIKSSNIIVIAINHINQKIEINPMLKTQPQLLYMKMDESMPGGNAPIYYAHNLIKFVSAGKYKAEDDGFDGFKVRAELLKSRTNKAGQFCHLVYNQ
ncbi:DNA recombination/repair protein RecA, partial [Brevibacillus sp. MCWH]|uniref:DNA recombination/repair protein RecA n=1 Tax=Brevibacillus sp. MCWH TaxID=2508871 RepID=UPI001C0F2122